MIDMLDNSLNSGWIAKTGAVTNNSSLFKTGNGQVIFLRPDAQMTDVQRIQPADIPPANFQLEEFFVRDMMENLGITPEMVGMAQNEDVPTAAVLNKMRQSAGLVGLEWFFQGMRESQKLLGQKIMAIIQRNYSPEKIKRITKKEPTPEFFSREFARYNIVVEEGALTETQRQTQFVQYLALKQMGIQVSDADIIENSNLHGKQKLKEKMAAQEQAQQEQQQRAVQLEMEKMKIEANAINSKAESDRALAAERTNKIGLDAALSAERIQRADEERTAGVLNLIKAVKEIQGMDIDQLLRKIEILKSVEAPAIAPEPTTPTT